MRIASVGCTHGNLEKVYSAIATIKPQPDLVLLNGDVQTVRNPSDLESMATPKKYQLYGDFSKYKQNGVPIPTIFIGGNHEASAYLAEYPHGGWIAPNLYYLGHAGVIDFGGYSFGGISGIFNKDHYRLPHFEKPPFTEETKRSVYHQRQCDVQKLWHMGPFKIDLFMSHDWPRGIAECGDLKYLLAKKPHFRKDIQDKQLGSPAAMYLLKRLQPAHWLSAHMHIRYTARYKHGNHHATSFLALDKALNRRKFLEIMDLPERKESRTIELNKRWVGICALANKEKLTPNAKIKDMSMEIPPLGALGEFERVLNQLAGPHETHPTG